jgi:hypothetical protein
VKFILDEHLPPVLARSLNILFKGDHDVIALRDKFGLGVTDLEWIPALSGEGRWVVISGDRRITRNKAEYNAFRASNLIGFFLSASVYKSPINNQAARLLILWDDICQLSGRVQGGAMFEIPAKAKIRQLKI